MRGGGGEREREKRSEVINIAQEALRGVAVSDKYVNSL